MTMTISENVRRTIQSIHAYGIPPNENAIAEFLSTCHAKNAQAKMDKLIESCSSHSIMTFWTASEWSPRTDHVKSVIKKKVRSAMRIGFTELELRNAAFAFLSQNLFHLMQYREEVPEAA